MDCIFCKIVAGEIPSTRVYEDDTAIIFLDLNQAAKGHLLIVPRFHTSEWHELDEATAQHIGGLTRVWGKAAFIATQADGYNLVLNNGPAAGQEVAHTHMHIIPRWKGDGYLRGPIPHRNADGAEMKSTAQAIMDANGS